MVLQSILGLLKGAVVKDVGSIIEGVDKGFVERPVTFSNAENGGEEVVYVGKEDRSLFAVLTWKICRGSAMYR